MSLTTIILAIVWRILLAAFIITAGIETVDAITWDRRGLPREPGYLVLFLTIAIVGIGLAAIFVDFGSFVRLISH